MFSVIVCAGEPPRFIQASESNLIITDNLQESTIFDACLYRCSEFLDKARKTFPDESFHVSQVPRWLINNPERHLICEETERYLGHTE